MFIYDKKLQYPVKIDKPNPRLAAIIISQYGGPDGELGASMRYLSQRYSMPFDDQKALLTDIGVEELGHLEMVGAIVHQLTRKLTDKQIEDSAFAPYFVDHSAGVYPTSASGYPWSAASMQVKGDHIADLTEDLAADATTSKSQLLKIPVYFHGNSSCFRITTIYHNMIYQNINNLTSQVLQISILQYQFPAVIPCPEPLIQLLQFFLRICNHPRQAIPVVPEGL